MNNDYIILTDEDGQPYIAHASFREYASRAGSAIRGAATRAGSAVRGAATRAATAARGAASRVAGAAKSGARYIAKVMGRNNKVRYIYDQAELDAYNAHKSGGRRIATSNDNFARPKSSDVHGRDSDVRERLSSDGHDIARIEPEFDRLFGKINTGVSRQYAGARESHINPGSNDDYDIRSRAHDRGKYITPVFSNDPKREYDKISYYRYANSDEWTYKNGGRYKGRRVRR